jgi:hypothetical protein
MRPGQLLDQKSKRRPSSLQFQKKKFGGNPEVCLMCVDGKLIRKHMILTSIWFQSYRRIGKNKMIAAPHFPPGSPAPAS